MLKKVLLLAILLCSLFNLKAQVKDNMQLGIEAGHLLFSDSENLGIFFHVEPKLEIAKNTFLGLRASIVFNTQKFDNYDPLRFEIPEEFDNGGLSVVPTLEYHFRESYFRRKFFRPYLGLGIGAYFLSKNVDVFYNTSTQPLVVRVKDQVGALIRGGFESGSLRFGLEYNLIQKVELKIPTGQVVGTVNNSYLGLSIGFIIGS